MKSDVYWRKADTRDKLLDLTTDVIGRIRERQDALLRATRHVLTRDAKCTDDDSGIFENVISKLYQLCYLKNKYKY
jgi:hypothetical protein